MLIVTELFNIAINDSDAKKSAHYSWVLDVTKLVVSGTQCMFIKFLYILTDGFSGSKLDELDEENSSTIDKIPLINSEIKTYPHNCILPSATKLRRLCFYTCLSVRGVCLSACWDTTPPGAGTPLPPPHSRRLLLRTVRILLECILFLKKHFAGQ